MTSQTSILQSSSQSHHEPDELPEAKIEKNSSTLFHHGDTEYPLIADWRLRISDLQLMNNYQNNPKSAIQRNLRALRVSVVKEAAL